MTSRFARRDPAPPDAACSRCGARDELVEDANCPEVYMCRACLARVAAQNDLIDRGLEGEPVVEG
ncbi:MAG: hypothetical protein ABR559_09755 [Gemmatimonadota bacterium]